MIILSLSFLIIFLPIIFNCCMNTNLFYLLLSISLILSIIWVDTIIESHLFNESNIFLILFQDFGKSEIAYNRFFLIVLSFSITLFIFSSFLLFTCFGRNSKAVLYIILSISIRYSIFLFSK